MKRLYTFLSAFAVSALGFMSMAQNELVAGDVKVGDLITLSDGSQWYVGTNEITNGSFDLNPEDNSNKIVGWTVGNYADMTTSTFIWKKEGGYDGGAYIQASKHTGSNGDGSICQRWNIETNTRYYFSFYLSNNSKDNQYIPVITLTNVESTGGGQNEKLSEGAKQLIGKNGEDVGEILGFGGFKDENNDGYGDWCQTACSFVSEEYTYLQFNARWLKENKIQACFDGFFLAKLYDPAEMTQSEVAYLALQSEINNISEMAGNSLYDGIGGELSDFCSEVEIDGTPIEDIDQTAELATIQAAIDTIKAEIEAAQAAIAIIDAFNGILDNAEEYLNLNYPGINEFSEALQNFSDYASNGFLYDDGSAITHVAVALEELNNAINTYLTSQEITPDKPANYTFLVDNPVFVAQGKWYIGQAGGDQRLHTGLTDNDGNSMTAWNAWRNNLNAADQSVSINQDLTNLPNGYYTVTADMMTQDGCITDQHVFANSSVQAASSAVMTTTGWDPYVWETLTTEKVLVVDGKLTIGAIGHGSADTPDMHGGTNTDSRMGWFCISNFVLNYYGPATDEEIAAAVSAKYEAAEAQANAMHLAADKATALAAIAEAKTASDLDALNAALAIATSSEAEYEGVINGTYKSLNDSIAAAPEAKSSKVAKAIVDITTNYINSAAATYKETGNYTAILRQYLNDFVPAIKNTEAAVATITSAEGKEVVNATIDDIVTKFSAISVLPTAEAITEAIAALNNAITVANAADVVVADGADVTAYLTNPTIDAETGWTMVRPVGDKNSTTSQGVDGNASNRYLDSWNGTAGLTRFTAYQTISVPNGTYTVKNIMRTSGDGVYLFASTGAINNENDSLSFDPNAKTVLSKAVVVATENAKYGIVNEAGEEMSSYTDSYGEIWMAAADRIIAAMNIMPTDGTSIFDLAVEKNNGSEDCPEGIDESDWNVIKANSGKGRGWFNNSLEIEVTNHTLTIGVTCDSVLTLPVEGVPFAGTWFSADNFSLIITKVGNNDGWNPTTGVVNVAADEKNAVEVIYSTSGVRKNSMSKGINIVKMSDGTVVKKLVK